jgi:integrase
VFAIDVPAHLLEHDTYYKFIKACKKEGLPNPLPRVHDARHAFATHALAAGLSPHAVARLMGHKDVGLVLKRYGDALPDELAGAGDALSRWRKTRAKDQDWSMGTEGAENSL